MKLSEFVKLPLQEALENLDMTDYKVHTDDEGNVCSVEVKYTVDKGDTLPKRRYKNELKQFI